MKKNILLLIILVCCTNIVFAENIMLKSGKKMKGPILEETGDYVIIDHLYLGPLKLYRFEIDQILPDLIEEPPVVNVTNVSAQAQEPVPQKQNVTAEISSQANLTEKTEPEVSPAVVEKQTVEPVVETASVPAPESDKPPVVRLILQVVLVLAILGGMFSAAVFLKNKSFLERAKRDYSLARGTQHLKQVEAASGTIKGKIEELKKNKKELEQQEGTLIVKLDRDIATIEKLAQVLDEQKNILTKVKVAHFVKAYKGNKEAVSLVNNYLLGVYPEWGKPPMWFKVMATKYTSE